MKETAVKEVRTCVEGKAKGEKKAAKEKGKRGRKGKRAKREEGNIESDRAASRGPAPCCERLRTAEGSSERAE